MNINDRFKELRNAYGKNQEEFGKILGITKSGVSEIESGRRKVTDQHLIMLSNWSGEHLNITWLRTGEGEMFLPVSRSESIRRFADGLMKESDDSFKRQLVEVLAQLDESEWAVLERIAAKMAGKEE